MKLQFLAAYKSLGLLIARLGLGVSFVLHGYPKMFGGPERWEQIGGAMRGVGIDVLPTFWGFMAAFAEFGGGILMILGFYFRPAVLLMAITMAVALRMHIGKGDPFGVYSHALELGIIFICLLFVGPGKLSVDGE
jgi:putative oxidoreductase